MAHEISNENFFDTTGKPAWHRLSVFEKMGIEKESRDYSATEIYALFDRPQYDLRPLYYHNHAQELTLIPDDQLIVVQPNENEPDEKIIGRVSDHYELVAGQMAAELWDKHVAKPAETMMMLKDFGCLVITAKLPDYDVKGEEIVNYLVYANGMNGKTATRADVSSTRVVCANTLAIAQSATVRHFAGSTNLLMSWMTDILARAEMQVGVMRDVFNILAETPATREQVATLADVVYPVPKKPSKDKLYKHGYDLRFSDWERNCETSAKHRQVVIENFEGAAIGFDDDACKTRGTAWHALNSVTQELTHSRTNNFDGRAESLLIGTRKYQIEQATNIVVNWSDYAKNALSKERELVPALTSS